MTGCCSLLQHCCAWWPSCLAVTHPPTRHLPPELCLSAAPDIMCSWRGGAVHPRSVGATGGDTKHQHPARHLPPLPANGGGASRAPLLSPACCFPTWTKVRRGINSSLVLGCNVGHKSCTYLQLCVLHIAVCSSLHPNPAGDLAVKLSSAAAMHLAVRIGSHLNTAWQLASCRSG